MISFCFSKKGCRCLVSGFDSEFVGLLFFFLSGFDFDDDIMCCCCYFFSGLY